MEKCFAVIIPTYRRPQLVGAAIDSALAAGSAVEVVVVDNGQSDKTRGLCEERAGVKYIRLANNDGPSHARNVGVQATRARYLNFLDDDDLLLPNSLERLAKKLETTPSAAVAYGRIASADRDGKRTGHEFPDELPEGDLFWRLVNRNFIMIHSALVRREVFEAVGGFNAGLRRNEDWDLWVRIAERWPFGAQPDLVGIVRTPAGTPEQITYDGRTMLLSARELFEHWMQLPRARNATKEQRTVARRAFYGSQAEREIEAMLAVVKRGEAQNILPHLRAAFALDSASAANRLLRAGANFCRRRFAIHHQ